MFLTRKSFKKILAFVICYFILGSIGILSSIIFGIMGVSVKPLFILGLVEYLLCIFVAYWGYLAEGKGKLINLGNKFICKELNPAEFLKRYEELSNCENLLVKKPCVEVLQLVVMAYDILGEREKALETIDEAIAVSTDKKRTYANLIKSSLLFSYGMIEEAELLFRETQNQKLDIICCSLADTILKSDRAMAMGDYKTAETFMLKTLSKKFPKPNNLVKLVSHFTLGQAYEKMGDKENAVLHYEYCANNGGKTAIKTSAEEKLQNLS